MVINAELLFNQVKIKEIVAITKLNVKEIFACDITKCYITKFMEINITIITNNCYKK